MNIKYRLESINETEYRFNYDFKYDSLNHEMINIMIGYDINPHMDENLIIVSAKVNIIENSSNIILATNAISMSFYLFPIKNVISYDSKGNIKTQDAKILDTLIITTIGTLRGVLMKNLTVTPLNFVSIPLIPIDDLRPLNK